MNKQQHVKGFVPEQLPVINPHRDAGLRVKAAGISPWRKAEIVAALMIGAGCLTIAACMLVFAVFYPEVSGAM